MVPLNDIITKSAKMTVKNSKISLRLLSVDEYILREMYHPCSVTGKLKSKLEQQKLVEQHMQSISFQPDTETSVAQRLSYKC